MELCYNIKVIVFLSLKLVFKSATEFSNLELCFLFELKLTCSLMSTLNLVFSVLFLLTIYAETVYSLGSKCPVRPLRDANGKSLSLKQMSRRAIFCLYSNGFIAA